MTDRVAARRQPERAVLRGKARVIAPDLIAAGALQRGDPNQPAAVGAHQHRHEPPAHAATFVVQEDGQRRTIRVLAQHYFSVTFWLVSLLPPSWA